MIPSTSLLASNGMAGARVTLSNDTVIGTSAAIYRVNSSGIIQYKYKVSGSYFNGPSWRLSGVAADYDVEFVSDLYGSTGWASASTSPEYVVSSPPGYTNIENVTVNIRDHSTLALLATASVYMEASN